MTDYDEPWEFDDWMGITNSKRFLVAELYGNRNDQALRVVKCVNACAGVAEMGSVRELVEVASEIPCPSADDDRETWFVLQNILSKFRLEADHASK